MILSIYTLFVCVGGVKQYNTRIYRPGFDGGGGIKSICPGPANFEGPPGVIAGFSI